MSDNITVGVISIVGPLAVAVTALILNFRLFNSWGRRIEVIEADLRNERLSRLESLGSNR